VYIVDRYPLKGQDGQMYLIELSKMNKWRSYPHTPPQPTRGKKKNEWLRTYQDKEDEMK